MKLNCTPLQSRLAASLAASILLLFIYFSLFSPQFAIADDHRLKQTLPVPIFDDLDLLLDERSDLDPDYDPHFAAFDRSILGRAPVGVTGLANNIPMSMNVVAGTDQIFAFEAATIFGREDAARLELRGEDGGGSHKRGEDGGGSHRRSDEEERSIPEGQTASEGILETRQSTKTVYISANTCEQPQRLEASKTTMDPPQLTMFVSTNPKNKSPGPEGDPSTQTVIEFVEGAVMYNTTTSGDVFIGIHAPNVSSIAFVGQTYNFQVAASVDTPFYSYSADSDADLIWVDSDSQGALLITHNLTDSSDEAVTSQIMRTQPYVMFAQNQADWTISGLKFSYCGLQNYAQIAATKNGKFTSMVTTGMTRRGPGNLPKQQFYFSGLNASTGYLGILALNGDEGKAGPGIVGGGGHVFRATNFTTKSDHGNCQIVLNLTFCDQVAYSVPSNPQSFPNAAALATFYDTLASDSFAAFTKALAQISCEAPPTQRYSLVRTCSDCSAAYKSWLCSVTIPRCEDFSTPSDWLQPRNLAQPFPSGETLDPGVVAAFPNTSAFRTSRNPLIDQVVQPGPYKEVLPCEDLCYNLTQSCPAALQFGCPRPGMVGFNTSYGTRGQQDENGEVRCNYPGSAHLFSGAGRVGVGGLMVVSLVVMIGLMVL